MRLFKNGTKGFAILLIFLSLAIAIFYILVSLKRELTALEHALLWLFALGSANGGSYLFGKIFERKAALPNARSAFRRLLWLYFGLSRLAATISEARTANSNEDSVTLQKLEVMVTEQIATADDGLEDWRDIIPDDVEEIEKRLKEKREKSINERE